MGDVVDEEERIGAQVGGSPETAIFFLSSCVGEGEEVGFPVYGAGYGVGVLWWGCGLGIVIAGGSKKVEYLSLGRICEWSFSIEVLRDGKVTGTHSCVH